MSDVIKLVWNGPFSLQSFFYDEALRQNYDVSGVYIWTRQVLDKTIISYVGKASGHPTLWKRHLQHYAFLIGGLYQVPTDCRINQATWEPDWTKRDVADVLFDPERFHALIDECFNYAKKIQVFLAECPSEIVKDVERNLLYELQPTDTSWGTKSAPGTRLEIHHQADTWRQSI